MYLMENTEENKPGERTKIDKSVERESAAILLQVKRPQLLQRLFSQNQASDDLWDLW